MHTIYFWDLLSLTNLGKVSIKYVFRSVVLNAHLPCLACHAVFCACQVQTLLSPCFLRWPQGVGPQLPDTRWLSALWWPLTFGLRGGVSRRLGEFIISCFVFLWVVLQGTGEMICMYVHVWCLQRVFVGFTAAKINDGIIDSFRKQLITRFFIQHSSKGVWVVSTWLLICFCFSTMLWLPGHNSFGF